MNHMNLPRSFISSNRYKTNMKTETKLLIKTLVDFIKPESKNYNTYIKSTITITTMNMQYGQNPQFDEYEQHRKIQFDSSL